MAFAKMNGIFNGLSGISGDLVFADTDKGTVMRQRNRNPRTSSPAQIAAQNRMSASAKNFSKLTDAQITAWETYAGTITLEKRGGEPYHPDAFNVYTGLASKLQQVSPAAALPTTPPTQEFAGDTLTITVIAAAGKITFTADKKNAPDVSTELLLQHLTSKVRRAYPKDYRTKAFFVFVDGNPSSTIGNLSAGWYAAAIRFVNSKTGQEAAIVPLGKVLVS